MKTVENLYDVKLKTKKSVKLVIKKSNLENDIYLNYSGK